MISFAEKRAIQSTVLEQNKILSSNPSFTDKRQAQKIKAEAMIKLGLVIGAGRQEPNAETEQPGEDQPIERKSTAHLYEFDPNRKPAQRKKDNTAAMALLGRIDSGEIDRNSLTDEQKATLAKYSGTGGALLGADGKIGSAYEYYTPKPIAEGIWDLMSELGFAGGKVLDPSAGVGVFGAVAPVNAAVDAIELNETSGRINGLVNDGPGYSTTVSAFEKVAANTPDESYDAIVTNVPFGGVADRGGNQLLDNRYQKEPLQNYFILRSLEKLKPGGLAVFITPPRCVSGKGGKEEDLRVKASFMAEFLGAYRLPNSVFGTASADTMTDVIAFRKYSRETLDKIAELREQSPQSLIDANVQWQEFIEGQYFIGEGKRFILGEFVPKDPNKFRDVDRVINPANVAEIGRMLKRFPGTRINWELLGLVETSPIIYRDGDTVTQSGQTLQMKDGRWVAMARTEESVDMAKMAGDMATPYKAFENKITWADAIKYFNYMTETSQALDIPAWVRGAINEIKRLLDEGDRGKYWNAGVVGMSVAQVLEERLSEEVGVKYVDEYLALSDAMQRASLIAKSRPSSIGGKVKDGLLAIGNHYQKKTGFSAVWRGDVQQDVTAMEITADSSFEGLRYKTRSAWVTLDDAKGIYGDDFDPVGDQAWCVSPDGKSVTRADDYYVGNYAEFLKRVDAEIAAATDDKVRDKLLRQKLDADSRVDRIDVSKLTFNLFTPYVTHEEKAEFLRRFVHPAAVVVFDEKTGEKRVDIDIPGSKLTDREKLLNRIGDYMKNGTITLGGAKLDMEKQQALQELRRMVNTANEQFNGWVRGNSVIMRRLDGISTDPTKLRFRQVEDSSPMKIQGMSDLITPHGYQFAEIRRQSREFGGINGFGVGLGKAQPLDAKILTPNGWVLMGDIQIGDMVISVDGIAVPVTGVFPQGEKEIFEIEFSDGSKTRCCDDHLWFTNTEKDRKNQLYNDQHNTGRQYPGSVKSLSEIRVSLLHGKKQKNHKIPMVSPVHHQDREFVIDPYVMGVLLGDGTFRSHSIQFTPGDDEIADYVSGIVANSEFSLEVRACKKQGDRATSFGISRTNCSKNAYKEELERFGLFGLMSSEKFVPIEYMHGSVEQRIKLLHGLMDTDGYVSKDGITIQFSSSSERLASDIRGLTQSLGGIAWINTKVPTYMHNGEKKECLLCYTVSMRMPSEINPFRLERKASRVKPKSKYLPVRYFTKVESVGVAPAQCISIDHPEHLYVTDDYIVTHNTLTSLAAVQYAQSIGVKKKTFFVVPNSVLSNWRKEAERAYTNQDDLLFVGLRVNKGKALVNSTNFDADLTAIMENRHSKIFMTMEAFERIRLRDETISEYEQFLRKVDASFAESEDKKEDERAKSKQSGLISILSKKTGNAPYLEDLGVDSIVVDEGHIFKNSSQVTDFKGAKFLSLSPASQRGLDAQAKAWFIRGKSHLGDGVLLLTATAITNSPLEIYSMLSLSVGHERVNDMCLGIKGADNFMEVFVQKENQDDVTIDGVARTTDVFVGLNNVSILRKSIGEVATIKSAEDVGEQIVVPDREEKASAVTLTGDIVGRLDIYKRAFRFAIDTLAGKEPNRGGKEAFEAVSAHFGEEMDLIGHPFNLINKMTLLIADPELDQRATFYSFIDAQADKAKDALSQFSAKNFTEERPRFTPMSSESSVVSRKTTKDEFGNEVTIMKIKVVASIIDGNRIAIDTITPETQSAFEDIAEKIGLDLDVSVPPKLAAMLENFQHEQATPRGVMDDGSKSPVVKQIIFCDILPLHNKIKHLLNKRAGIPSGAIAIITGKTNNKPDEILSVQDGFNAFGEDNKYRVVIANEKAEVGINLQRGTQAIHHLTIGWTPDSLEQRNGRGVRQGNKTGHVNTYYYDADGTFDTSKRAMVNKKADWIGQVMDVGGSDNIAVTGGLSREQMEALIEVVGDADAMKRMQETIAAKEAETRAATNRDKQMINIDTIRKQNAFLRSNPSPVNFIIDKILGLWNLEKQMFMLNDRINNPKATASAVARNERLLSEVNARISGLRNNIEKSATISKTTGYNSVTRQNETATVNLDEVFKVIRGNRKQKDDDVIEMLRGQVWPSFKVSAIEGGPITNDWQSEVDMANSMIEESKNNFIRQASEHGSYPAEVARIVAEGGGDVHEGKPVVTGMFIRFKDGALGIVNVARNIIAAANKSGGFFNYELSGSIKDAAELIYPGSSGYDSCLDEAAKLEDKANSDNKVQNAFNKLVPEIAQRRKTDVLAEYTSYDYVLPQPHFPFVITSGETVVEKHIMNAQSAVIKSIRGTYFVVPGSLAVTKKDDGLNKRDALIEYAIANHLKLELDDFGSEYWIEEQIRKIISVDMFKSALTGSTEEEIRSQATNFMLNSVTWLDFEGLNPIGSGLLPRDLFRALNEAIKAVAPIPVAATSNGMSPSDIVGIKVSSSSWADISVWKENIKAAAVAAGDGKYKFDKNTKIWNVLRPTWDHLIANYPGADFKVERVEGTLASI